MDRDGKLSEREKGSKDIMQRIHEGAELTPL